MHSSSFAALLLAFVSLHAAAADWSQFRGPGGNGVSDAKGTPLNWSDTAGIAWKTDLPGPGTSSPIVFGNKIFLTCYTGVQPGRGASLDELKRHLLCLDRATGKLLWNTAVPADLPEQSGIREDHGYAGRKLPERDREAKKITLFRPTGLQVVFTLLCLPDLLNANYRQIAKAAGVALGTVGWAMYDLRGLGYLIERGKLKRKLVNKRKLLDAWVTAYAHQLRPKLFVGRFRAPRPDWWQNVDWRHFNAFLGGEAAAAKLTDYLKPERTTIYAAGDVNPLVLKYHLRKDTAGDVELIKAFWHFDDQGNYPDLVPPLLVYADLLATAKDRNIETGKLIYDQYLTRLVGED